MSPNTPQAAPPAPYTRLGALANAGLRVLLVGPPGIGKTARIAQAAKDTGRQLVVIRASLSERVDLGGALVPDTEAGVTRELPLATLHALRQPSTPPTILLLDDLGQAPVDVQAACMRLFDPGYLSPNVLIWAATNRPHDKAGVSALCEPLRSRFDLAFTMATPPQPQAEASPKASTHAQHRADTTELAPWADELEQWLGWAATTGANVPVPVRAWHRASAGRTLYQWQPCADPAARFADFRAWEAASKIVNAGLGDLATLSACLGAPVATEYLAFARLADNIPTLAEIAAHPDSARVPSEASELWFVATAVSASMGPDNIGALDTYLQRLPAMFRAMALRDAYRRVGAPLARTPEFAAWFRDNQHLYGVN